jgi:hypothetical protein
MHGDRHGVHIIPLSIAAQVPKAASEILARERALLEYIRSPGFAIDGLTDKVNRGHCGVSIVPGQK